MFNLANGRVRPTVFRRGAMLPLIALLLPLIILLMGFAVDLAYMQDTRMELRAATDAAARAAANTLARTDKIAEARKAAKYVAQQNLVAGVPLEVDDTTIAFGRSEPDDTGKYTFQPDGNLPNSVQVTASRSNGSAAGGVPLFFGTLYGRATFEPRQTSIATFLNVDICLVLDQSTSMKQDADSSDSGMYTTDPRFCQPPGSNTRWMGVDEAIHVFTAALRDTNAEEKVGVVTYSSDRHDDGFRYCGDRSPASKLELHLDENLNRVDQKVEDLTTAVWNGNTNIEAGMRAGLSELESSHARKYSDKVMIVLTDGAETTGSALSAAQDCAANNVVVHTITFGVFADQAAMEAVASAGMGEHHHASDDVDLKNVFLELAAWVARLTQ